VIGEIDPVALAFYRYLIAIVCLTPLLPAIWPRSALPVAEVAKIALLGVLFFGFFPWAFSAALQETTAARGAVSLATIPVQTLLVAAAFGRERLSVPKVVGACLAFAGVAVVFGPAALASGRNHLLGDSLMLLGAFAAALYSVFGRPVFGRHGPMLVMTLAMGFGVTALAPLALAGGALAALRGLSPQGWLALVFLGTVGGAMQFALFTWALRWLAPSRAVLYLALNPISAVLLAMALLSEPVTPALLVGLLLVLAAIAVANWPAHAPRLASEPSEGPA
jgi:drug/metabolite transporter (DMT)-like permease